MHFAHSVEALRVPLKLNDGAMVQCRRPQTDGAVQETTNRSFCSKLLAYERKDKDSRRTREVTPLGYYDEAFWDGNARGA